MATQTVSITSNGNTLTFIIVTLDSTQRVSLNLDPPNTPDVTNGGDWTVFAWKVIITSMANTGQGPRIQDLRAKLDTPGFNALFAAVLSFNGIKLPPKTIGNGGNPFAGRTGLPDYPIDPGDANGNPIPTVWGM